MNRYAFLMLAMSMEEAKALLGFGPQDNPSEAEITKAWRTKAFEMHPDRGGDPAKMVEVNVAKDVLTGKQRPTYDRSGPSSYDAPSSGGPTKTHWEKAKTEEVSFDEAKSKAGVPGGVDWQFVTDTQRGTGYSSDEFYRSDTCWVAYGKTDSKHVFVAAQHFIYKQYFIGAGADQDKWAMKVLEIPISGSEGTEPAWLYGNVVKAMKLIRFEGKFNSKVVDARGWHFSEKAPRGSALSIKHWLAESGAVAGDDPKVMGRKHVIEVAYGKSYDQKPHHYQVKERYSTSDWQSVAIVCNGKAEYLDENDITRFMQAGLLRKIFGDYTYGGEKKNVTRMRDGKKLLQLFVDKFNLSPSTKATLEAAISQMK
jgi:hypothetical protein